MEKLTPVYPISDEQTVRRSQLSVEIALMEQRTLGVPIVEYDSETKKVYRVYNDGTKIEVKREEFSI